VQRLTVFIVLLALSAVACGTEAEPAAAPATSTIETPTTTSTPPTTAATTTTTAVPTTTTTAPPTTTTTTAGIVPGEDADVDAVVIAYETVFDSETSYEDKAAYLDDPSGLEDTVQRYFDTGELTGRVTIEATAVEIGGDTATITYTILFGGAPTYADQKGEATRGESGWQVSRDAFCALMTSARVGCPLG
jgi:hypothetical protein